MQKVYKNGWTGIGEDRITLCLLEGQDKGCCQKGQSKINP